MNRNKLMLVAFIPAMAMMGLSACNRAADAPGAQGFVTTTPAPTEQSATIPASQAPAALPQDNRAAGPTVAYAEVTRVKPVTIAQKIRGTVTAVEELVQESTAPGEVCEDVVVEERQPERDGVVGGTVVGAVVGGALGNQVGKGDGRKLATLAGAIAGGFAGREIDQRNDNGKVITRTEQQCRTEDQATSEVIGYQASYRLADGSTGIKRMDRRPSVGSSIDLGSKQKTVGYDVTYSFEGEQATVRMDRRPGDQLPVIDGRVVLDSRPISKG